MRSNPVMKTVGAFAALSFATALAGSAMAQSQPMPQEPTPAEDSAAPADDMAPMDDTTGVAAEAAQPAGIPTNSPTPVDQAYLLKAGDPTVVSNPPVADTPETRRAYGGPDSNGGKKTRAVGN